MAGQTLGVTLESGREGNAEGGRGEEDEVAVEEIEDARRREPEFTLGEREMLEGWLEFHRMTLLIKCEGLDDDRRKARPVATSKLSLHGLVRHMAEVERGWFSRTLLANAKEPYIYYTSEEDDDIELTPLDNAVWEDDLAIWQRECERSRGHAARFDLDHRGRQRSGNEVSLRWIYTHMIEEYARHNGHADLIRELVDGAVGW
jgi:uncharacterized damage-inducible protein DinB